MFFSKTPFVLLALAFSLQATLSIPRLHQSKLIHDNLPRQASTCESFAGNSDLYGLGIRLGVYLQWVSSWLINTLNPSAAAANHDANSIFVLAIVVALAVTVATGNARPVEAYIMLLICYGHFLTVLTIFGLRVRLLNRALFSALPGQ